MAVEELGLAFVVEGWRQFFKLTKQADDSIDGIGKSAGATSGILQQGLAVALGVGIVKAAEAAIGAVKELVETFVGFAKEGFDLAVDFESAMVGVELAASATGLSFDDLKAAAIAVGGDTRLLGVSASGAADALTSLFKSGLKTEEVFGDLNAYMDEGAELGGALRASIDLAAATTLDMGQAADLATIVMSTFGNTAAAAADKAGFVNDAMNNLVQAADASVAEVSDLAQALSFVGPNAAAMGLSIEDTNNALAVMSGAGIKASRAGTGLDAALTSLSAPTDAAIESLRELGVDVFDDLTGAFVGFPSLIDQFNTGLGGMTLAEEQAALGAIFTNNGLRAMRPLLEAGAQGWDDMALATADAATIQEQAAKRADTFAGQMEAFEGQVETLKIQIGDALLPVATDLLGFFAELVDEHGPALVSVFETVAKSVGGFIEKLLLVATGEIPWTDLIPPGILETGKMLIEGITTAMQIIIPVIGALGAILIGAQIAQLVSIVSTAFSVLASIFTVVSGPLLLIIGGIALLGAIIAANWGTIQPILVALGAALMSLFQAVLPVVAPVIQLIGASLSRLGMAFGNLFTALSPIISVLGGIFVAVIGIAVSAIAGIVTAVGALIMGLATALSGLIDIGAGIIGFFVNLFNLIVGLVTGNAEMVAAAWQGMGQALMTILTGLGQTILGIFGGLFTAILGFVETFVTGVITFFTSLFQQLVGGSIIPDMVNAIITSLTEMVQAGITAAGEFVSGIVGAMSALPGELATIGKNAISALAGAISAGAGAIRDAARNAIKSAISAAKTALGIGSPSTVAIELGANFAGTFANTLREATPMIQAQIAAAVTPNINVIAPAAGLGQGIVNNNQQSTTSNVTNNNFAVTPEFVMETVGMVA